MISLNNKQCKQNTDAENKKENSPITINDDDWTGIRTQSIKMILGLKPGERFFGFALGVTALGPFHQAEWPYYAAVSVVALIWGLARKGG